MKDKDCVFCNIGQDQILMKNDLAYVINDKYPHSKGHILVIPYNHVEAFFDLTKEEQASVMELVGEAKKYTDTNYNPSGYNIDVNVGKSAGQIVMHTHVHLIPRY